MVAKTLAGARTKCQGGRAVEKVRGSNKKSDEDEKKRSPQVVTSQALARVVELTTRIVWASQAPDLDTCTGFAADVPSKSLVRQGCPACPVQEGQLGESSGCVEIFLASFVVVARSSWLS